MRFGVFNLSHGRERLCQILMRIKRDAKILEVGSKERRVGALSFHLIVIFVCIGAFFFSVWQGQYTVDPHHWGLMLSNAKDLSTGKLPYKEIFIQYGILPTLIHRYAFEELGRDLISLISVTALFYSVALYCIFRMSLGVLKNQWTALICVLLTYLFHPVTMSPWANYIASPFLFGGLLLSLRHSRVSLTFLGGILFGFAVLCREGLLLPLTAIILFFGIIDKLSGRDENWMKSTVVRLSGVFLPAVFFFIYLLNNKLLEYWKIQNFDFPRLFAKQFFPASHSVLVSLLINATRNAIQALKFWDGRWILLMFAPMACLLILISSLKCLRTRSGTKEIYDMENTKLAFASLVFLSTVLHGVEVFRFATASAVGFIPLVAWFNQKRLQIVVYIMILWMAFSAFGPNSGNYYFPSKNSLQLKLMKDTISETRRQKWPAENQHYYLRLRQMLESPFLKNCEVNYQYNMTKDSLFAVITPFTQLQLAPFFVGESIESLRPDKRLNQKRDEAKDLVILREVKSGDKQTIPEGYFVWEELKRPQAHFFEGEGVVQVLAPLKCRQ